MFWVLQHVQQYSVDLEARKSLNEDLQCLDFQWYLDQVYPYKFRMEYQIDTLNWGRVKNRETRLCLDTCGGQNIQKLSQSYALCQKPCDIQSANQGRVASIFLKKYFR